MFRYRMVVVTPDKALKRSIKRLTTATGSTADFVEDVASIQSDAYDVAICDARQGMPRNVLAAKISPSCNVLHIIAPDQVGQSVGLLEDSRVTSLFTYDKQFNNNEFISSVTKALRGDVFGLPRYFPWGVATFTMVIKNYQEKLQAIDIMMQYALRAGVRGPTRDRIQLVADELMMNALFHAPVDSQGLEYYRDYSRKSLTTIDSIAPIEVQYACSGSSFGLSVRDSGGSLTRQKALSYLKRSTQDTQIEQKSSGAGLGLLSILRSVSNLIFNIDPGTSTEVIALFDMEVSSRGQIGARSLHIFKESAATDAAAVAAPLYPPAADSKAPWAFAAALGLVALALAGALYLKKSTAGAHESQATLRVIASPSDASITINGAVVRPTESWNVPSNPGTLTIVVERQGFESFRKKFSPQHVSGKNNIFVNLTPTP